MKSENVANSAPGRDRPVTAAYLERAALHYLERYSASTTMLRQTLARRVARRGADPAEFSEAIETIVRKATASGLVDDSRFAAARLATLRRRGTSTRGASAKLAAKGVAREIVEATLAAEEESREDRPAEIDAAHAYARRRRIGPFRPAAERAANRERDLAALARAGFGYDLAREILDAEPS